MNLSDLPGVILPTRIREIRYVRAATLYEWIATRIALPRFPVGLSIMRTTFPIPSPMAGRFAELRGFPGKHRHFPRCPPLVISEISRFPDDPVTGDEESHRVPCDGRADGARGSRCADLDGDMLVRNRASRRDADESLPHPDLKIRPPDEHVQRGVVLPPRRIEDPTRNVFRSPRVFPQRRAAPWLPDRFPCFPAAIG